MSVFHPHPYSTLILSSPSPLVCPNPYFISSPIPPLPLFQLYFFQRLQMTKNVVTSDLFTKKYLGLSRQGICLYSGNRILSIKIADFRWAFETYAINNLVESIVK